VNYRTSHQIRQAADRLLPKIVRDVDGVEEERFGTVSVFNGPEPLIKKHTDFKAEAASVAQWISEAVAAGISPFEIGIFVRSRNQLDRARSAVHTAGHEALELSERGDDPGERISIGTMHLAKGLEFKAVAVMACDDDVLPLQSRVESVADEVELDDVYETERQLLYVACTRARDRLLISAVDPGSEFLKDLDVILDNDKKCRQWRAGAVPNTSDRRSCPRQYGRTVPLTVVRNNSRRWSDGKSSRACIEQRLSHTMRSPTRQTWR
jgi:superfamily I DNA/RNA helicase